MCLYCCYNTELPRQLVNMNLKSTFAFLQIRRIILSVRVSWLYIQYHYIRRKYFLLFISNVIKMGSTDKKKYSYIVNNVLLTHTYILETIGHK